MSLLVDIKGLTKTYGEGQTTTQVLKGIDIELQTGEQVALLGASGSGKSTLLNILGTLMQPTSGRYEMLGENLVAASDAAVTEFRNRHIGFVFQFHNLMPDFTALENVVFPAAVRAGGETAEARARAKELLARVGLDHRINFRAGQLSGGQKQRVAIARALMNRPELVLADEPTGNLDRESAEQVMALLEEINRDDQTTFLISTHDPEIARRCSREIRISDGRVVTDAPIT